MLQRFAIANVSMSPALMPGDYVIAVKRRSPPRRGEVVVYEHPEQPGFHLVKRVVALPGETVRVDGGEVIVNGAAESRSPGPTPGQGNWTLGTNEMFVMGDRRDASDADSRHVGPIPASPRYVVAWRYWPKPGRITPS